GDEAVSTPRQRLDEDGLPRVIAQHSSNLEDVTLQNPRLNVSLGPQRLQQLSLRHQSSSPLYEEPKNRKRLRRQEDTFVDARVPRAPKALVIGVESKGGKALHRGQAEPRRYQNMTVRSRLYSLGLISSLADGRVERILRNTIVTRWTSCAWYQSADTLAIDDDRAASRRARGSLGRRRVHRLARPAQG